MGKIILNIISVVILLSFVMYYLIYITLYFHKKGNTAIKWLFIWFIIMLNAVILILFATSLLNDLLYKYCRF